MRIEPNVLRFDASQVPALITTFEDAIVRLEAALADVMSAGRIPEPWLGDEVSQQIAAHFNRVAVEDEHSGVNVIRQYKIELQRVVAQLRATAGSYLHADSASAETFTSS